MTSTDRDDNKSASALLARQASPVRWISGQIEQLSKRAERCSMESTAYVKSGGSILIFKAISALLGRKSEKTRWGGGYPRGARQRHTRSSPFFFAPVF